jgi:hypothetical protein
MTLLLASLRRRDRLHVDVEGDPGVCVTQELLGCLQVGARRSEVRRQRVTEAVPFNLLSSDLRPDERGANDLLQNHVGCHRRLPPHSD